MSAASASSRTTKMIWLSPPVSLRVRWAMYTPETAVLGTVHERGDGPVAAVDQAGGREALAGGLRARAGRRQVLRHHARPVAAVVAEPQDVDVEVRGGRGDLERDRLALVDAHRRREALDRLVAVPVDLPLAARHARLRVLARDGVDDRRRAWRRQRCGGREAEGDERGGQRRGAQEEAARGRCESRQSRVHTTDQRGDRGENSREGMQVRFPTRSDFREVRKSWLAARVGGGQAVTPRRPCGSRSIHPSAGGGSWPRLRSARSSASSPRR